MVKIVYIYDVPEARQAEYLKATAEKIKPFWESHGCQSYSVWQVEESPTTFIKEMLFKDTTAMQQSVGMEEAKPAKELFYSFATNVSRKICMPKV